MFFFIQNPLFTRHTPLKKRYTYTVYVFTIDFFDKIVE